MRCLGGCDRSAGATWRRGVRSSSMEEVVVVGKQTVRQAARLAASQVQAKYRRERAERDRRIERLAVEVLTALGERDAMIAATEQRAGAAHRAVIIDEHLTVSEAVQWCAGAISHREAARLRQVAGRGSGQAGESQHLGCQRSATRHGR